MENFKDIKILTDKSNTVKGSEDKWMIDPEGNCYLSGKLDVRGSVDPTFLTLTNQTSSAGIPTNAIFTSNDSFALKDANSNVHEIVPLRIRCRATSTNSTGGISIGVAETTILSLTITPSSSSVQILIQAAWTGNTVGGEMGTPNVELKRGLGQLAHYSGLGTPLPGTRTQPFGGAIAVFDTISGTTQRTYSLTMDDPHFLGTWEINHASLSLIEVQADT